MKAYLKSLLGTVLSVGLISAAWAGAASAQDAAIVAAAKKEGALTAYGDPTHLPPLAEGFMKKYPEIKVETVSLGGWRNLERHLQEKNAGRTMADIIYTGEDVLMSADTDGEMMKYRPPNADRMPDFAAPKDAGFVRVHGVLCVFLYNENSMKGLPLPKDWTDFADPKPEWKDIMITADARNSSAVYAIVQALYSHYGDDKTNAIFKGLKASGVELSPNAGPQTAKLMSGERPMTPTLHTGYWATMLKNDAPIKMIVPESGAVPQYVAMGITKEPPHPNAAKLFLDFVISEEGQAILAGNGAYGLRKGAVPPKGMPAFETIKVMATDPTAALKERDAVIAKWQKALGVE